MDNTVRSLCVKVPKGEGESVRKKLIEKGILDIGLRIVRTDTHILIPVLKEPEDIGVFEISEEEFEERDLSEGDYKALADIPEELQGLLPTSFDTIGDIGIIRLPDALLPYKRQVGDAMRKALPRLRMVALDGGVKGEHRVRELTNISGEGEMETVHQEYGLRLHVDPSKVYFNPRLANERMRVAKLVTPGEMVVDMFTGVGPFAIMIAKYSKASTVFAIDINHDAVEYLKRNIVANRATNVVPIEGDSRQVIFEIPCSDRIVMNLPHSAREFYADALTRLNFGGTLHLYHICEKGEIDDVMRSLAGDAMGMGVKVEIVRYEELKTYSPSSSVFSIDLKLLDWF
ncbi:MAG: class I SAM-dependent methyltransferase family protein [Methanomassiliicoccales archaeon]|nr:MAG: class I SAM-dependent methyltransferase family protein [Methanomassiliicoccales archaeon]